MVWPQILLLSSENWKIVVDWGIRLVDQGKNVLAVHFKKGSEAQAADVYMSARRRVIIIIVANRHYMYCYIISFLGNYCI